MSRVIIDDVAVERNLDRRESAVVGGGSNFSLRLNGPAYPYAYPYGYESSYGCEPSYGYDYGYIQRYPQVYFNYGNFDSHRRSHDFDRHDRHDDRRWSGHHGRH